MSNNLGAAQVIENQDNKETTINDAVGRIDSALTEAVALPVDDTNAVTLTELILQKFLTVKLTEGTPVPNAAITVTVEDFERGAFVFRNETSQDATVEVSGQTVTSPIVAAGAEALLYLSEGDVREVTIDEPANPAIETLHIRAADMVPAITNGAAEGSVETTTNSVLLTTLDFDQTTDEFAQFSLVLPEDWDGGAIQFEAYWSHAAATAFDVVWGLAAMALADSDALDTAFGTTVTVSDTGGTTDDLYVSPKSGDVTIAGAPVAGELVFFRIQRDVSADTLDTDARLHGIRITINDN